MHEFQAQLEKLFFEKNQGVGIILDGRDIHVLTVENCPNCVRGLSKDSILINKFDLDRKLTQFIASDYMIVYKVETMNGKSYTFSPQDESGLGQALFSGEGEHSDEGSTSKIIGVVHFAKESWVKQSDELNFKQHFTLTNN